MRRFLLCVLLLIPNGLWAAERAPVFHVVALGVLGGDIDTNLTSYLVGRPGAAPALMIDAGSIEPGIVKWKERRGVLKPDATWSQRAAVVYDVYKSLQGVLITHSHMDHLAGLVQNSTLNFAIANAGGKTLPVCSLPATRAALTEHLFRPPLWIDFTTVPAKNPTIALVELPPGAEKKVGGFDVRAVPLNHPVPSAAYFVRSGDEVYLHLGDTGASTAVWKEARTRLKTGHLRGIAMEVSWPSSMEAVAVQTGHLTPPSFLLELNKLAKVAPQAMAASMTEAQQLGLARALAPTFARCPIMAIHIKAREYDAVVATLKKFQAAGLNLIIPEQGGEYDF
jgi:cAMP phosphodiesterase